MIMTQAEQLDGVRSIHVPRTRSLTLSTYEHLLAGEEVVPDMYGGIFPNHDILSEGYAALYDTYRTHYELAVPQTSTERLLEMFRMSSLLGQYVLGPNSALVAASYPLEVNDMLRQDQSVPITDLQQPDVQGRIPYPFKRGKRNPQTGHPAAYCHVINSFMLGHERAISFLTPELLAMKDVNFRLSFLQLGRHVVSRQLDVLRHQLTDAEYYTERNRLPYKNIVFQALSLGYPEQCGIARKSMAVFNAALDGDYTDTPKPDKFPRSGNYDITLRIICGGYASLRKAGVSPSVAVAALYGHGSKVRAYTKAVNDALPFRLGPNHPQDHAFEDIYEQLVPVDLSGDMPELQLPIQEPYANGQLPSNVSTSIKAMFTKKRITGSRCPARHALPPITGPHYQDHITPMVKDIIARHGVDPYVFHDNGWINPTSLIFAMTIRQSEKYDLFSALDRRMKQEGLP